MNLLGVTFIVGLFAFIGCAMIKQEAEATTINERDVVVEEREVNDEMREIIIEVVEKPKTPVIKKVWDDIPLTEDEQVALWDKCHELNVNYWFILALLESESNYDADATGDSGKSVGYMQINKANWERMKTTYGLDVHEPKENLLCGATIFWELANKYDTITQVVMSYKCGETRAKELLEQGIILSCVETITNRAMELENTHK